MSASRTDCSLTSRVLGVRRDELSHALRSHAAGCVHCTRELDALDAVIARTRDDGSRPLAADRSERLRARVLESARRAPRASPSHWRPIAAAFGIAAVVAVSVSVGRGTREEPQAAIEPVARTTQSIAPPRASMHGTVRASAGAHFTRVSEEPDEIVRLLEGSITVSVTPLGAGERFRVIVGDAEVEVRGTAFDVSATGDHLSAVDVFHGRVEVRVEGREPILLEAGERWARADEESPVHEAIVTTPRTRERSHSDPTVSEPDTLATAPLAPAWTAASGFEVGWNALAAGDAASAATAFGEVVTRAPRDPLAEDASFWRGVALARAGRSSDARDALDAFVHGYPSSPRTNEAAVMLGWLLVDEGEIDRARAMFTRGTRDPSERVRASAERGLAALAPP